MTIHTSIRPPIRAIAIPTAAIPSAEDEAVVLFGIFCLLASVPFVGVASQYLLF